VSPDLSLAREAAEKAASAAESVINDFQQRGNWSVSLKQDASPVTEVDVASEQCIKSVLTEAIPEAGFYGEETGITVSSDIPLRLRLKLKGNCVLACLTPRLMAKGS